MKLSLGKSATGIEVQEARSVLFVCIENAARSQMAEAFFRKYMPTGYLVISAGTRPAGEINPIVIQAMREVGIDIRKQKSKVITEDMIRNAAIRVNMGCMDNNDDDNNNKEEEACPILFVRNLIEWKIEDPKGKSLERVREIRDDIELRVRQLAADLVKNSQHAKL